VFPELQSYEYNLKFFKRSRCNLNSNALDLMHLRPHFFDTMLSATRSDKIKQSCPLCFSYERINGHSVCKIMIANSFTTFRNTCLNIIMFHFVNSSTKKVDHVLVSDKKWNDLCYIIQC